MQNLRSGLLAGIAVALCMPLGAFAQDKPETKLDPKVKEAFEQAYKMYQGLNSLHEKITVTASGSAEMLGGSMPDSLEIRYQKPNKLWVQQSEKKKDGTIDRHLVVSDGTTVWRWESASNTYTKQKAPATFKAFSNLPSGTPEADALFRDKDPFEGLPAEAQMKMGQPTKVGDVDVDVIDATLAQPGVDISFKLQILIGQKDRLFRGISFNGGGKDPSGKEMKMDLKMDYTIVNPAPTFTPADFAFTPPQGAKLAGGTPQPGTPAKAPAKTPPAKGGKTGGKKKG